MAESLLLQECMDQCTAPRQTTENNIVCIFSELKADETYRLTWSLEDEMNLVRKVKEVFTSSDLKKRNERHEEIFNTTTLWQKVEEIEELVRIGLKDKASSSP